MHRGTQGSHLPFSPWPSGRLGSPGFGRIADSDRSLRPLNLLQLATLARCVVWAGGGHLLQVVGQDLVRAVGWHCGGGVYRLYRRELSGNHRCVVPRTIHAEGGDLISKLESGCTPLRHDGNIPHQGFFPLSSRPIHREHSHLSRSSTASDLLPV